MIPSIEKTDASTPRSRTPHAEIEYFTLLTAHQCGFTATSRDIDRDPKPALRYATLIPKQKRARSCCVATCASARSSRARKKMRELTSELSVQHRADAMREPDFRCRRLTLHAADLYSGSDALGCAHAMERQSEPRTR